MYFNRQLKPYGLSHMHFRMLSYVARHEGLKQEDIRLFIDADKGGVAHAIKRLVDKGYVERDRDPSDGRAYVINLTDDGSAFLAEFRLLADAWGDQMTAGFSDADIAQAESLLQRMADNSCALLEDDCEDNLTCHK
ncbi:MAG: MarR family transcriptional regulator [Actinomycetota bacterium]|nr:MarR family transcriptional regulator [Actinomycetota bacterium]